MYKETDLVRIAKRENNKKRKYLVVNRLQGKHIPVKPGEAMRMFEELGDMVNEAYPGEKLLLIGFAETATAIGAAIACQINACYMQTTRELDADVNYLFFCEEHSHATEQKLVRNDMDRIMDRIDRIVFVEDEVTTGNTIMNIIRLLKKEYPLKTEFSVASLLNGMNEEHQNIYRQNGIDMLYLVKTSHEEYETAAQQARGDGCYRAADVKSKKLSDVPGCGMFVELECQDYLDARRLVQGDEYQKACDLLQRQIEQKLDLKNSHKILVLGTEEFMFPALYTAYRIEEQGMDVRFHATTRSPIVVSTETDYPLHTRYELKSLYDDQRTTFIYDLEKYDQVLVITDAAGENETGRNTILDALMRAGNEKICFILWK